METLPPQYLSSAFGIRGLLPGTLSAAFCTWILDVTSSTLCPAPPQWPSPHPCFHFWPLWPGAGRGGLGVLATQAFLTGEHGAFARASLFGETLPPPSMGRPRDHFPEQGPPSIITSQAHPDFLWLFPFTERGLGLGERTYYSELPRLFLRTCSTLHTCQRSFPSTPSSHVLSQAYATL